MLATKSVFFFLTFVNNQNIFIVFSLITKMIHNFILQNLAQSTKDKKETLAIPLSRKYHC